MAIVHRITEQEYIDLALEDSRLELWDGEPREKPAMSSTHAVVSLYLAASLIAQLDKRSYLVNHNEGKARISGSTYFIPDVIVVPANLITPHLGDPRHLAAWREPLPLVVEVWSPSTGAYDLQRKLTAYRERGDHEIWYLQPYDRILTTWRKHPVGTYDESVYTGGVVVVMSLPGVMIDLDDLLP
ncbi:MAG: Uma2 family endonuclease [Thermomicrobiales bacterium]